jgi:hypothetical protein
MMTGQSTLAGHATPRVLNISSVNPMNAASRAFVFFTYISWRSVAMATTMRANFPMSKFFRRRWEVGTERLLYWRMMVP